MIEVSITNKITKETKNLPYDYNWDGDNSVFDWQEGNMACDCQLHNIFHTEKCDDISCGNKIYHLNYIKNNGLVVCKGE